MLFSSRTNLQRISVNFQALSFHLYEGAILSFVSATDCEDILFRQAQGVVMLSLLSSHPRCLRLVSDLINFIPGFSDELFRTFLNVKYRGLEMKSLVLPSLRNLDV